MDDFEEILTSTNMFCYGVSQWHKILCWLWQWAQESLNVRLLYPTVEFKSKD